MRFILLAWIGLGGLPAAAARAGGAPAATRPASRTQTPDAIERTAKYYLDLYGRYARSADPLARAMVAIGLAGLDDPRATDRLIAMTLSDRTPLVRVYAWEALHARLPRLTDVQRIQWTRAGFRLDSHRWLRGDLRVGLVDALGAGGPTPPNKARFRRLFQTTNSRAPGDMRTLDAMGRLLAHWKSPDLIRHLADAMAKEDTAWRAEYVLRRLGADVGRATRGIRKVGSVVAWREARQAWLSWLARQRPAPTEGQESQWQVVSALLPGGEKITDAGDPRWRKDLELERFHLKQLDVGFLIDSTGSMGPCVRWIQRDVVRLMRAFEIISREPRIGVTFYRDYKDDYLVKPIPLSDQAQVLSAAMKNVSAGGGKDIPEAVYAGLKGMLHTYRWSGASARKIIVLLGDAPPHENELEDLETLIGSGVKRGFVFYAVKIRSRYDRKHKRPNYDPKLATFDKIAALGGGRSFWVDFHELHRRHQRHWGYASPRPAEAPERIILREVLKAAMAEGYEDRVNHFVNVLEQFIERSGPETRRPIPPYRKPKRRPPPRKPRPRRDPQD